MTEYVRRAAFLDQVRVGQRIQLTSGDDEPWTVTGKRLDTYEPRPGRDETLVCLVGIKDDGSPRYQTGASWVGVIIYEPVEVEEQQP